MRLLAILSMCLTGCTFNEGELPPPPPLDSVPSQPLERIVVEPRRGTCDFRGATTSPETTHCDLQATRFYVVSDVVYPSVGLVGGQERTLGLDLDDVHTTGPDRWTSIGCGVPDFFSPDGAFGGIDNQAAFLRPTFDAALASGGLHETSQLAITEGRFGAVIELRNWNETPEDDCVDVFVYEATFDGPELDASGELAIDQPVALSSEPRVFANGRVHAGELRADLGGFPIPQPFMADLHNAHVRLELADSELSGLLVGELPIETGIASLTCRAADDLPPELTRALAESLADLRPGANGCTSLSWGVSIRAVRAVLD